MNASATQLLALYGMVQAAHASTTPAAAKAFERLMVQASGIGMQSTLMKTHVRKLAILS